MSLTERIQALTAYSNEVTSASDATLSEAIATLANGYGNPAGSADWTYDASAGDLTQRMQALINYSNTITGAGDSTLSECVATLASGYGADSGVNYVTCLISDGGNYINSGIARTSTTETYIKFAIPASQSVTIPFGGGTYNQVVIFGANVRLDVTSNMSNLVAWTANEVNEYNDDTSTGVLTYNGTEYSYSYGAANSYPWGIFSRTTNTSGTTYDSASTIKLYEFYMNNGTNSVHLYPCLDPDGVACLYDTVSETYFYDVNGNEFSYEA